MYLYVISDVVMELYASLSSSVNQKSCGDKAKSKGIHTYIRTCNTYRFLFFHTHVSASRYLFTTKREKEKIALGVDKNQ